MKRNFILLMVVGILVIQHSYAQVTENFNPRQGVAIAQLKGYLQNHCWTITDLDISRNSTGNEPNGVLLTGPLSATNVRSGIYTPVLDVPAQMTVSFTYQFSQSFEKGARRWLKIYLADANNMIISKLDSIECTNSTAGSSYTYNKTFSALQPGAFKVFLNPQGTGGISRMAIDQVAVSAPLHYAGGCNASPVAVNDNINGLPNHVASGQVTANDKDPDQDAITAYLVNNSPDGTVAMQPDGSFTFTPRPGFTGNSTTFSYRVCDNGSGKLCSQDAKVTLNFPTEAISLNDFKGLYNNNGQVAISWATSFEQNSSRFEIERSFDGVKWQSAGSVKAQGVSTDKQAYGFTDEVGRNAALKKDLYYRLKQINDDGKVALSRLLVVRVYNTRALKMVSVTPNPAKNDIAVTTQLNETSFVAMKIFDASGAVVLNKALKADAGANSFIMEGSSHLQPGMYMLDVTVNSKERMMVKLIKE
jgi:stage V sporulation protein SpoVS